MPVGYMKLQVTIIIDGSRDVLDAKTPTIFFRPSSKLA